MKYAIKVPVFIKKAFTSSPSVYCVPVSKYNPNCGADAFLRIFKPNIYTRLFSLIYGGPIVYRILRKEDIFPCNTNNILVIGHPEKSHFNGILLDSGYVLRSSDLLNSRMNIGYFLVCSGSQVLNKTEWSSRFNIWVAFKNVIYLPSARRRNFMFKYFFKFYSKIISLIWLNTNSEDIYYQIKALYLLELESIDELPQRKGVELIGLILQSQYDEIISNQNINI